ncbi:MAG: 50S ribosomal protein L11 methyltransferase [Deltaproteobacteria bacterium]|nr:50S ribosomal protein L11 methyltransferase [Candidatus Anaeroferrophillus wilburensis]MBN2888496.1 50S ribosomal protein L11 methyltransferase [Deltaproteobacteria bacterium]
MAKHHAQRQDISPPFWWSLRLVPLAEYHEQVTRQLFAAGCCGLWEPEEGCQPGTFIAYFPADRRQEVFWLREQLGPSLQAGCPVVIDQVKQENWMDGWKQYFQPVDFASSWRVVPPWTAASEDGARQIIIHPGMAFGTGTHETTRLAADLLAKAVKPGDVVLDVGTGSGILAILAEKLGAAQVTAIDIDVEALANAAENCRLNRCRVVTLLEKGDDLDGGQYDLVVANIIAPVLIELSGWLVRQVKPGGCLILSGILDEQLASVTQVYAQAGLTAETPIRDGEWGAFLCRL